ncbi:MAG: 1-acyl-sn-glycerol-3-phosphate acyltransferase, partial [Myxococcales bacterium]
MPRWVAGALQRFVLAPGVVLAAGLLWFTAPIWLIAMAVAASFVPAWLRPVRVLWLMALHLTLEAVALLEMLGLWIASGFGLAIRRPFFERIHYDIAQTYLWIVVREARRVLHLKIEMVGEKPDAFPGSPLLVFSRHAGPGDSFTLMYALMHWYHREPRVVLKDTLRWDPALGILLGRLPSRFVGTPRPGEPGLEEKVGELARNLDENDAFLIFPEGGNFTPARRDRQIERLRKLGLHAMAERAETMIHVLAPR